MQQTDIFPFWQYKTHGDGNVRPSHAALNGKIFPAGHDIWQRIFPPWDWGCRCIVVPLTRRSADALVRSGGIGEQEAKDAHLLPTQIAKPEMFSDREATLIDKAQRLPDGKPLNRTPTWSDSPWSIPGNVHHDWKLIRARYADQPEVLAAFEQWAGKTEISKGVTVDEWLGSAARGRREGESAMAEARWPRVTPPTWADPQEVSAWRKKLNRAVVRNPLHHSEVLKWDGDTGPLSKTRIARASQSFLDLIPRDVATAAGAFRLKVVEELPEGAFGKYDLESKTLTLAHNADHKNEMAFRSRVWHEMSHWLWFNSRSHPRLAVWRDSLEKHFIARTAGDVLETSPGGWEFLRDKWIDTYAGRRYKNHPDGVELASVYFEQVALGPETTAGWMIEDANRETFNLVTSVIGEEQP